VSKLHAPLGACRTLINGDEEPPTVEEVAR
jgi:hypothetical protein